MVNTVVGASIGGSVLMLVSLMGRHELSSIGAKIQNLQIEQENVTKALGTVQTEQANTTKALCTVQTTLVTVESRLGIVESRLGIVESRLDCVECTLGTITSCNCDSPSTRHEARISTTLT